MTLEYAPRGLLGVLTPQANTTVEPEFNLLLPPGIAMINARLVSAKDSMTARLLDYFEGFGQTLDQFANAPIGVAAAACTGSSYLAGREREAALVADITSARGYPFVTAALAVVDALRALEATSIALVSPYPDDLTEASRAYWQSHGFEVREIARPSSEAGAFHPVYSLDGSRAGEALNTLAHAAVDAVVMLGTGMPTLRAIATAIGAGGAPVISCNLCLAWRSVTALKGNAPDRASLSRWLKGEHWQGRLAQAR
jgi:maleate cis-trans isomerase